MTRSMTGWLLLVSAFGFALVAALPGAFAHGGDPALVHSCVNKSSGEVKIVSPNATCKPNENAVDWPGAGGTGSVTKVLTEISLVSVLPGFANSGTGERSRFLWEPNRYDPAPSEIYFEVVAALSNGVDPASVTFRLHDMTNNLPIPGSSLTIVGPATGVATGVRLRSGNLTFPAGTAEIALIAEPSGVDAAYSIQRSAVLLQQ